MKPTAPLLVALAALAFQARAQTAEPVEGHRPLTPFATRKLVVLPLVYVQEGDSLGWAVQVQDVNEYRRDFDAEVSFVLKDRGLDHIWVLSDKLAGEYKRNSDYMADPYALAADWLRFPGPSKIPQYLPDPLAAQLRSIQAMNEKAEYVLLPIEIRFVKFPTGGGQAMLRAAIIDPRRLKILWMGDVPSEVTMALTPALLTSIAENLSAMFIAPH